MSDQKKDGNNPNTNDFFAKFDKISDDFKRNTSSSGATGKPELTPLQQRRLARNEQAAEQKTAGRRSTPTNHIARQLENQLASARETNQTNSENSGAKMSTKAKRKHKRKYKLNFKRLLLTLFCMFLAIGVAGCAYVFMVVKDAVEIDPDNIYELLAESSVLYDQNGQVLDNIFNSPDGKRTNIAYSDLPENLRNAFVAIEDKTFWDHDGFNFIRIAGAVKESVFGGGRISGTSTITQQLARNLYLTDSRSTRTLKRKTLEAYYTILLEKHLSKQQILEAYLNTISLGFSSSGVQAASQAYFSKDVGSLTLTECVALAAIPQSPTNYSLIKTFANEDVTEGNENIIYRGNTYTYVYNGEASKDRRNLILRFMKEQGYITETVYQEALQDDLKAHLNPTHGNATEYSSYFTDYVIQKVLDELIDSGYSSDAARYLLYNGGLRIYTTVDPQIQQKIESEFSNNDNFPKVANLKKDSAGNLLNVNGNLLLYSYDNYFDANGTFTLMPDEYAKLPDGSLLIYAEKRLNFYKTEVQGQVDYSVEFKNMYRVVDNIFYSIDGGFISIPQEYKDKDKDGNLLLDAKFFEKYPDFFTVSSSGLSISSKDYALKQSVVQPQSAMVITEIGTGHIKAMVGGRNTVGRLLFNRADRPRQPGSSIKPMAVYAPALQLGLDTLNGGSTQNFITYNNSGNQVENMYGKYFTAASVIDDAPLSVQGKIWPKNWYSGYRGLYTLRTSVEQSVNVNAVKVFQQIGPEYSSNFLKKLGVTTIVESGSVNDMNAAALALGGMTHGVSPLEMAGGYSVFANSGTYIEPISYTKVTDKRGGIILENVPQSNVAMDKGTAFIITDILRTTVSAGIAGSAAIGTQPVAGKTGTTTDNFDAWFVGLTPQYSAALWIGNDVNIELREGSPAAARLWSKIMKQACAGLTAGSFPAAPSNVISVAIDTKSGLLPSDISALDPRGTVRSEYFIQGTQPTQTDNIHAYVTICAETAYLSTPLCPYRMSAYGVSRPYTPDPSVGDLKYEVPHTYCYLHNPDPATYPVNPSAQGAYQWETPNIMQAPEDPDAPPSDDVLPDGTLPNTVLPDGTMPNNPPQDTTVPIDPPNSDPAGGSHPSESTPIVDSQPPTVVEEEMPEWLRPRSD